MDQVIGIVTYLAVASMAAERLTDILKKLFLEKIVSNGVVYQLVSAVFGGLICYLSPLPIQAIQVNQYVLILITALAVSGGSSTWNSILNVLKDYKKGVTA